MMAIVVKETGQFICHCRDFKEGRQIIMDFEEEDKNHDCYSPMFYEIRNDVKRNVD